MIDTSYQCGNCGYRFTPKHTGQVPTKCPYCNKPDTIERVKSAQDYLDDVTSDMEERDERQS